MSKRHAGGQTYDDAQHNAAEGKQHGFPQDHIHDIQFGGTHRLEDADFAGPLHDCGIHGLENDDETDDYGNAHHHVDECGKPRIAAGGHHGEVGSHGVDYVALHARHVLDFIDDGVGAGGIVEFEVEDGGLVFGADQVLKGAQGNELTGALATLHNAGDAEYIVENFNSLPDRGMFGLGKEVVDQYVVGSLKRTTFQIVESAGQALIAVQVDSGDDLKTAYRTDLGDDRSNHSYVRQLCQDVSDLNRHRRAGQSGDERRSGRQHEHVSPDAGGAGAAVLQHAQRQADDEQDHGDFERDRDHADQGA